MEILLLQDIPGIGKKDDLLVVGDGYALNKLLPNREALVATPTVRRRYAEQIRRRAEEKAKELAVQHSAASVVKGAKLTFARKVTKTGKLYAAISEKHLADELKKQLSLEVKVNAISIAVPIKELGLHTVLVKLAESEQKVEVEVVQEK
jgi:large subunit ribosomal protein L9